METKKALVVDDSKSARFAMRKFLEAAGYQVETADCAREAYATLRNRLPDVIFLDHVMPDIDGFEALDSIKREARTAAVPVVLCSSNEASDFIQVAQSHGALAVLLKPPSSKQISDVLQSVELQLLAVPPMTSNKVQPIREPEIAIEQAVMKTLRDALPVPGSITPALRVVASGPTINPPTQRITTPVARPDVLRAEMETRLQKITHELFAQLAETRAKVAHLDGDLRREDQIKQIVAEALDEQFSLVTRQFEARVASLRGELDDLISAQSARIDRLGAELREAVTAEAHAVSERVVMNAATRISDQIAESILNVLKPNLARAGSA